MLTLGATTFPAERGVERMNNNYDAKLWAVLESHKMADLSQFHQPGFFDEAPLYTREAEVDFLKGNENANPILVRFALKFLKSVIAFEPHPKGYFAAITVRDFSDDLLVPNLFAWCRPVQELKRKLALRAVTTAFGKRIARMTRNLGLADDFKILEDKETDRDSTRVFIGPAMRPYHGFATLDSFYRPVLNSK